MALGSENMVYHHQPAQYHHSLLQKQHTVPMQVLRTRNVNTQRNIAPAPYSKTSAMSANSGTTLDSNNPAVVRRNARERNRVKNVNSGFSTLRQHIPTTIIAEISNGRRGIGPGASKKLSKVDTLRMAAEYIRRLKRVIDEVDNSDASSVSSYGSFSTYASSISSSSPPPTTTTSAASSVASELSAAQHSYQMHHQQQQQQQQYSSLPTQFFTHQPLSYVGSFQQHNLISPANSTESYEQHSPLPQQQMYQGYGSTTMTPTSTPIKYEPCTSFDDFNNSNDATEDDELLDYISLWQDE